MSRLLSSSPAVAVILPVPGDRAIFGPEADQNPLYNFRLSHEERTHKGIAFLRQWIQDRWDVASQSKDLHYKVTLLAEIKSCTQLLIELQSGGTSRLLEIEALSRLQNSTHPGVIGVAASNLVKSGTQIALKNVLLYTFSSRTQTPLAQQAAIALQQTTDTDTVFRLCQFLQSDASWQVVLAATALIGTKSRLAQRALCKALDQHEDDLVLERVSLALRGADRDAEATESLIKLARIEGRSPHKTRFIMESFLGTTSEDAQVLIIDMLLRYVAEHRVRNWSISFTAASPTVVDRIVESLPAFFGSENEDFLTCIPGMLEKASLRCTQLQKLVSTVADYYKGGGSSGILNTFFSQLPAEAKVPFCRPFAASQLDGTVESASTPMQRFAIALLAGTPDRELQKLLLNTMIHGAARIAEDAATALSACTPLAWRSQLLKIANDGNRHSLYAFLALRNCRDEETQRAAASSIEKVSDKLDRTRSNFLSPVEHVSVLKFLAHQIQTNRKELIQTESARALGAVKARDSESERLIVGTLLDYIEQDQLRVDNSSFVEALLNVVPSISDEDAINSLIQRGLRSTVPKIQREISRSLSKSSARAVIEKFCSMIGKGLVDEKTREIVARSLTMARAEPITEMLIEFAQRSERTSVRSGARWALNNSEEAMTAYIMWEFGRRL